MEFPREETSVMDANYASIRKPAEIMFIPSNMGKAKTRRYYQVRWEASVWVRQEKLAWLLRSKWSVDWMLRGAAFHPLVLY